MERELMYQKSAARLAKDFESQFELEIVYHKLLISVLEQAFLDGMSHSLELVKER